MNDKEMIKHINALTKIINQQNLYAESLTRQFTFIERRLDNFAARIIYLEGIKVKEY